MLVFALQCAVSGVIRLQNKLSFLINLPPQQHKAVNCSITHNTVSGVGVVLLLLVELHSVPVSTQILSYEFARGPLDRR